MHAYTRPHTHTRAGTHALAGDLTGRRWWMVCGLCSSAAGLACAACGGGFGGALLLGVEEGSAGKQLLQLGYLQLSSCLLVGDGAGRVLQGGFCEGRCAP